MMELPVKEGGKLNQEEAITSRDTDTGPNEEKISRAGWIWEKLLSSGFTQNFITALLTWLENRFNVHLLPQNTLTSGPGPTEAETGGGSTENATVGMDTGRTKTDEDMVNVVKIRQGEHKIGAKAGDEGFEIGRTCYNFVDTKGGGGGVGMATTGSLIAKTIINTVGCESTEAADWLKLVSPRS